MRYLSRFKALIALATILTSLPRKMNPYKKPTVFHKTSIDTAKTTYTTIALAGQKRTLDEYKSEGKRPDQIPLGSIASKGDFR